MRPKFNLRLRPNTKYQAASYKDKIELNENISANAVDYCKTKKTKSNCRGYKLVKQDILLILEL